MPEINLAEIDEIFKRPGLLTHHNIPRPLSSVAPRNIMGEDWWNVERYKAYEANSYYCWACGGPGPLQAHEAYHIVYKDAKMFFIGVTALCRDCHDFIHNGRLTARLFSGKVGKMEYRRIMLRGYDLLVEEGLFPSWCFKRALARAYYTFAPRNRKWMHEVTMYKAKAPQLPEWDAWRMVFRNKEYPPMYKSKRHYELRVRKEVWP